MDSTYLNCDCVIFAEIAISGGLHDFHNLTAKKKKKSYWQAENPCSLRAQGGRRRWEDREEKGRQGWVGVGRKEGVGGASFSSEQDK